MGETGRKLGDIDWSSDTARHYRAHILAPWFAHWLHDKPMNQPEAVTFRTGSNVWKSYDKWPPTEGITTKKVYFRADGKLMGATDRAGGIRFVHLGSGKPLARVVYSPSRA